MKRIFKQCVTVLCGFITTLALADEGEMYSVSLNGKPQVLIILDTSTHMKFDTDYPYPEYYDPNMTYPPTPDTNFENFIFKSFLGGDEFYYNNSSAAKAVSYAEIKQIAEKAVKSLSGGQALNSNEQAKYDAFIKTIPHLRSSNKYTYKFMNCYAALADFQGDLGAYKDHVAQWFPNGIKLGDGVVGVQYQWLPIGSKKGILKKFVDCQGDISNADSKKGKFNPGYEQSAWIKHSDGYGDGESDGYREKHSRQGYPSSGAEYHVNAYKNTVQRNFKNNNKNDSEKEAFLYSDNLVKWASLIPDSEGNIRLSNLQVAKKIVLDLMLDTTDVDTGLEIFNPNNDKTKLNIKDNHGGRVIAGITSYDKSDINFAARKSYLKDKVKNIFTTGYSKSALCESLYEGYRYMYGDGVYFGDDFRGKPRRDKRIETNGKYKSPLDWKNSCQTEAYIIIVSAGYHDVTERLLDLKECTGRINDFDHDDAANKKITKLPGLTETNIADRSVQVNDQEKGCDKNLLPVLSGWLAENDINKTTDTKERIVTYTVGIGENMPEGNKTLLSKTAEFGDGEFYNAGNVNQLKQKLEMVFADIIARQSATVATVSTSVDSNNVMASNNTVYYSMFQPNQTSKWNGNLKKLTISDDGELSGWTDTSRSVLAPALSNDSKMFFKDDLYSGWSAEKGLNDLKVGGVAKALTDRSTDREIYITNADNTGLLKLTKENLKKALGVDRGTAEESDANLADALGVSNQGIRSTSSTSKPYQNTLDAAIAWLQGKNESGKNRSDIFGDPMHARPLVVDFDDIVDGKAVSKPRIFVGTNAGFFHAFKDNGQSVTEEWAFIPKENLKRALSLRSTITKAEERIYGFDATAVDATYIENKKTKHIITFGERRGGNSYYSLNVDVDSEKQTMTKPSLNWIVTGDSKKVGAQYLSQLGQTWSTPVIGKVFRGENNAANNKPVLFFGGGYDDKKDNCGSNGGNSCADLLGKAIYIVDADTGTQLKSFNIGIEGSIASQLAIMDSDGDGYTDRVYAPDTSGNIYRADMPVLYNKTVKKYESDMSKWKLFTLAKLGGTGANDRRFFNPPSLVRASDNDINRSAYDGLLIGSGDIANPNSNVTAQNYFFNIKDTNIYPQVWAKETDDDTGVVKYPDTVLQDNLQKLTYNSDNSKLTTTDVNKSKATNGWALTLNKLNVESEGVVTEKGGEKSLGNAVVIDGVVHFNTYSPFTVKPIIKNGQCMVNTSGSSRYYQLDLNSGYLKDYRSLENIIAKDISVHVTKKDKEQPVVRLLGIGKGDSIAAGNKLTTYNGSVKANVTLSPRAIYRYMNEQNDAVKDKAKDE